MGENQLKELILGMAKKAKIASRNLATLSSEIKNDVLKKVAQKLRENKEELKKINEKDVNQAVLQGKPKLLLIV